MSDEDLGSLLIKLRGTESLRDAAKRANISHNYLRVIEKGVDPRSGSPVKPTPETLRSLANAYNYPYLSLMRIAGYVEEANEESAQGLTHLGDMLTNVVELIENYSDDEIIDMYVHTSRGEKLTEDQIRKILSYCRFVLNEQKK